MKTRQLTYKDTNLAAKILQNGGIIAFPTETVYGLGVVFDSKEAFDHLVEVKRRRPDKPFTLMCGSIDEVEQYAVLSEFSRKVMRTFLPGPLTIVMPIKQGLPAWVDLNSGKIGIRVPKFQAIRNLIINVGKPLLVPSANRADEPPELSGEGVMKEFNEEIDGVIFGNIGGGQPSTIIEIDGNDNTTLLRNGELSLEQINQLKSI
ncbi:MAG TPA: threonylcarbamoyl-AMP synthase [Firmicutes bacterium]|nr:threonylcarbamoyl-AMP synthase [Bacillota bacterium]